MSPTKQKVRLRTVRLVVGEDKPGGPAMEQTLQWYHAERLLRMPNNGGWQLPKNSDLELSENGLRTRKSKRAPKSTK